jgi:hypothetical protein
MDRRILQKPKARAKAAGYETQDGEVKMTLTLTATDGTLLVEKCVDVQEHKKAIEVAHSVLSSSETLKQLKDSARYYEVPK